MRCKLLLYLSHNDYAIWVCDIERAEECVVIQYCTSALPAAYRDHCLAGLWGSRNWRVGRHYTNIDVFTKCTFVSDLLFLSACVCQCSVSHAQRWVGEIRSFSAAARLMKVKSWKCHSAHSFLRQHCLPLSALVWNWIADPLALSGRDVIWDSGNRMFWCRRQLLQDTDGSEMMLDS